MAAPNKDCLSPSLLQLVQTYQVPYAQVSCGGRQEPRSLLCPSLLPAAWNMAATSLDHEVEGQSSMREDV